MLTLGLMFCFFSGMLLVVAIQYNVLDTRRPTLNLHALGISPQLVLKKQEAGKLSPLAFVRKFAAINKPLVTPEMRKEMFKYSALGMSPEEFLLMREMSVIVLVFLLPSFFGNNMQFTAILMSAAGGWILPTFWVRGQIQKIKDQIVKQLPDAVDLLGLCVNAGLDFMMALKWVVDKSAPSVTMSELNNVLQEINVGKPRREALRDLAKKYELPDLSTFARTLIQADKMGTSVSEALTILSEDMRLARFRRGEAMALKAPLKLLAPLLFCIFPVVGILVGAPIFLDFMYNNPLKHMAG